MALCARGLALVLIFRMSIKSGFIGPGITVAEYGPGFSLFASPVQRLFSFDGLTDLVWMYLQGFRAAWLIVIAYFFFLVNRAKYVELFIVVFALAIALVPAAIVADVARSVSYSFPVLLIAIIRFQCVSGASLVLMSRALLFILILNYATPAGFSFGGLGSKFYFYYPLPIRIWRWAIFPAGMIAFYWRLG